MYRIGTKIKMAVKNYSARLWTIAKEYVAYWIRLISSKIRQGNKT
jgi:hypothetical protein